MKRAVGLALAFVLALLPAAFAQTASGNVYGVVNDESGAAVPGANITVKGVNTAPKSTTSDASGNFRFINLDPGSYEMTVGLAGFSTVKRNFSISTGQNLDLKYNLKVTTVEETITVTGEQPIVDTKKVGTGTTLTKEELSQIPNSRDPWAVLRTIPGVVVDRVNIAGNESGQQSSFQGKGSSPNDAMWNLDGVVITDMAAIGASPTYFDYDAFDEINVTTGGHDLKVADRRHRPELRHQARHQLVPRRRARVLHAPRPAVDQHQGHRPRDRSAPRASRRRLATRPTTSTRSPTTASTSAGRSSRTSCGSGVRTASRTSATSAPTRPRTGRC